METILGELAYEVFSPGDFPVASQEIDLASCLSRELTPYIMYFRRDIEGIFEPAIASRSIFRRAVAVDVYGKGKCREAGFRQSSYRPKLEIK